MLRLLLDAFFSCVNACAESASDFLNYFCLLLSKAFKSGRISYCQNDPITPEHVQRVNTVGELVQVRIVDMSGKPMLCKTYNRSTSMRRVLFDLCEDWLLLNPALTLLTIEDRIVKCNEETKLFEINGVRQESGDKEQVLLTCVRTPAHHGVLRHCVLDDCDHCDQFKYCFIELVRSEHGSFMGVHGLAALCKDCRREFRSSIGEVAAPTESFDFLGNVCFYSPPLQYVRF